MTQSLLYHAVFLVCRRRYQSVYAIETGVIGEAAHFVMPDQPAAFRNALDAFLAS